MENTIQDKYWKYFKLCSIEPISADSAQIYQMNKGYIPAGYGFYKFECVQKLDSNGLDYYEATWKCAVSCE